MFNLFKATSSSTNSSMKGFKVSTNEERSKKYGIAANSLKMLREKISSKLNLKLFKLFLSDGILIDDEDYFQSIAAQSHIIVAGNDEEIKTGKHRTFQLNSKFSYLSF